MIEVEGILVRSVWGALYEYTMHVFVLLSPWRTIGTGPIVTTQLTVIVAMDMDEADSWMQALDDGDGVRVLVDAATLDGVTHAHGGRLREHPIADALAAASRFTN